MKRGFHADGPDVLWLADVAGFSVPAGKACLSPIIDCFDGKVAARTMSTSPNAELVNTMLDEAAATLKDGEHPVGHNDRGCRYRRPGWIERRGRCRIAGPMPRKGRSPDDSAMEGLFGRLKAESFYGRDREGRSIERFVEAPDGCIEWYDERRIGVSIVHSKEKSCPGPVKAAKRAGLACRADASGPLRVEATAVASNLRPRPRRCLRRFAGTGPGNLRSHPNRLACLLRASRAKGRWPGTERAVRHLLQVEARYRS